MTPHPEATSHPARVLLVEDDPVVSGELSAALGGKRYETESVASGEAALAQLRRALYDLVLLNIDLPGVNGLHVLEAARALQTDAQFIVVASHGSIERAVDAMKLGAFDYIAKPYRIEELLVTLERAVREKELRREVARLRTQSGGRSRMQIVGTSPAMERVFELIERVAPMKASVLVTGETGTGKELVARALHQLSNRAARPFIPVNCSALPETLLESELFGHVKGSFTGAIADKRGLFEEAHGGTLMLDEIATVSTATQIKLLRVLQEKQVKRIGGNKEINVDFRLVAASNLDLDAEVEAGRFRADLHYRLNVFPIRIPPLRERRSDIPLLANYFRMRFCEENAVEAPEIAPETMERLVRYDWPGNVRELENFIERAMIMHAGSPCVPFDAVPSGGSEENAAANGVPADAMSTLLHRADEEVWTLDRLEREHILRVLERTRGQRTEAAELLGIARRTLYRKLRQYEDEGVLPDALRELVH